MGGVPDPLEATFAAANPLLHAQGADARGPDTVTIGVAVPIPEPFGSELQKWRESFHDPMARAIPTHVTLLPPTEVGRADLADIEDHLAKAASLGHPFPMLLQGTDTFRPISPVTFVRVAMGAEQCAATEALVRSGVLAREARFPYHPHVTVAHELPEDVLGRAQEILAGYEARFLVTGFALYLHGDDGVWRVRRYFPYGG
ncbi:2'-5' RNA ligase family protein [Catenulispora subtropica]|uniref:2'-5' RNA ligase family protein n=1 Tax=Catenulispora subtropica TaxID=450798 RepID=A0ABP5DC20_9ACTN